MKNLATLILSGLLLAGCSNPYDYAFTCEEKDAENNTVTVEEGADPVFSWTGGDANYVAVYGGITKEEFEEGTEDCTIEWQLRGDPDAAPGLENTIKSPVTYGQEDTDTSVADAAAKELVSGETYLAYVSWGCDVEKNGGNSATGNEVNAEFTMP